MMKRILLGTLIAAILATMGACVKTSDIALLTHMNNLLVTGEFNPELGIPVGYATIQSKDLVKELDFGGHNVTLTSSSGVMTYTFDTSWTNTVPLNATATKTADTLRRNIHGELDINLFEAAGNLLDSVNLNEIMMSMDCLLKPSLNANTTRLMNAYGIQIILEDIELRGIGADGTSFSIRQFPSPVAYTRAVARNGFRWLIFDKENVIPLIKRKMQRMTVDISYTAVAPNVGQLIVGEGLDGSVDVNQWLMDNVKMESVTLDADVNMAFPFKFHISGMHQSIDIHFNFNDIAGENNNEEGLAEALDFDVDSGYLVIEVVNGMPLDVDMNIVADSAGQNVLNLLDAPQKVPAAKMKRNGDSFFSSDTSHTTLFVALNRERMASLRAATAMHMNTTVSSGTNMAPGEAYDSSVPVALRHEDQLQLRLYVIGRSALSVNLNMGSKNMLVK
ncbi:MAG: hypothetical protein SPJ13_02950 [Bacteroidales bacterium]|nr:hypothetical protein [Bacteroidales bacterium]